MHSYITCMTVGLQRAKPPYTRRALYKAMCWSVCVSVTPEPLIQTHTCDSNMRWILRQPHLVYFLTWFIIFASSHQLSIFYITDDLPLLTHTYQTCARFCCAVVCRGYIVSSLWLCMVYLPISHRLTALALGQPLGCPSASEATLKCMQYGHLCCISITGAWCDWNYSLKLCYVRTFLYRITSNIFP